MEAPSPRRLSDRNAGGVRRPSAARGRGHGVPPREEAADRLPGLGEVLLLLENRKDLRERLSGGLPSRVEPGHQLLDRLGEAGHLPVPDLPFAPVLVELLLELAEPAELLLEVGIRDLGPPRELPLDVEELLGRLEDPPLLVPVEDLEPVLGGEVRLEDGREDVRVVVRRAEPVLDGPEAVEDLLLREVLESVTPVYVLANEAERLHRGRQLRSRGRRSAHEPEKGREELGQLLGEAGKVAAVVEGAAGSDERHEEVHLVEGFRRDLTRVEVEAENRQEELLVLRPHLLEEAPHPARGDLLVVRRERAVDDVEAPVELVDLVHDDRGGLDVQDRRHGLDLVVQPLEVDLVAGRIAEEGLVDSLEELVKRPESLELLGQPRIGVVKSLQIDDRRTHLNLSELPLHYSFVP
ncbi:MAG: hypothetical protein IPP07_04935 [Holophagales bacterium]|nr:hypothetical protein [Holophagales bacterium]